MPTFYQDIQEMGPPFDLGQLDTSGRVVWIFNLIAYKDPSVTFQEELVALLEDAAVGTLNVDIFYSSKALIPVGPGPYLSLVATGGPVGVRIHNITTGPAYERPTAQITVRASTALAAEGMCRAAYAALVGVRNQMVTA